MNIKKTTSITVNKEDADRLRKLKKLRENVPKKKPLGRGYSYMESMSEVFKRAVDALEGQK